MSMTFSATLFSLPDMPPSLRLLGTRSGPLRPQPSADCAQRTASRTAASQPPALTSVALPYFERDFHRMATVRIVHNLWIARPCTFRNAHSQRKRRPQFVHARLYFMAFDGFPYVSG